MSELAKENYDLRELAKQQAEQITALKKENARLLNQSVSWHNEYLKQSEQITEYLRIIASWDNENNDIKKEIARLKSRATDLEDEIEQKCESLEDADEVIGRLKQAMKDAINTQTADDRSEILQRTLKAAQPQGDSDE